MLTKVRIEVEEQTVGEVVDALSKYEHAIQCAEAQRYEAQWPAEFTADPLKPGESVRVGPSYFSNWRTPMEERDFFNFELGAELVEEVIEYDSGIPAWKGRRVVAYKRLDSRSEVFAPIVESEQVTGNAGVSRMEVKIDHGTAFLRPPT